VLLDALAGLSSNVCGGYYARVATVQLHYCLLLYATNQRPLAMLFNRVRAGFCNKFGNHVSVSFLVSEKVRMSYMGRHERNLTHRVAQQKRFGTLPDDGYGQCSEAVPSAAQNYDSLSSELR